MAYEIVVGWDDSAGLVELDPQPATPDGMLYPEVTPFPMGYGYNGRPYIDVTWNAADRDQYNDILTAHGLSDTVASAECTAMIRKNDNTFADANVIANYTQEARRQMAFWGRLTIRYWIVEWL